MLVADPRNVDLFYLHTTINKLEAEISKQDSVAMVQDAIIARLKAENETYRIKQILYNANAFLVEKLQKELKECNCNK
jgi:sulfur transfer complex TusBCD TusB component (DsrH family)